MDKFMEISNAAVIRFSLFSGFGYLNFKRLFWLTLIF